MATVSGRYVTGGVTHTFTLHLTAGTSSTGQGGSFTITVDGTYTYTGTTPQIVKVSCPTFSQTPYQRFSEDGYSQWPLRRDHALGDRATVPISEGVCFMKENREVRPE